MDSAAPVKIMPAVTLSADMSTGSHFVNASSAASVLAPLALCGMTAACVASCLSAVALAAMVVASAVVAHAGGVLAVGPRRVRSLLPLALAAMGAALAIMLVLPDARAGLFAFCNGFIWCYDEVHGAFAELIAPGDTVCGSVAFGVCLGVVTGVAWWGATRFRNGAASLIPAVFLCGICLHWGVGVPGLAIALGCLGWLVHCRFAQLANSKTRWQSLVLNLVLAAGACLVVLVFTVLFCAPGSVAMNLRDDAMDAFDTVRFGERALPAGNMVSAASMNDRNNAVIKVNADSATTSDLLLRGFTGASFSGDSWKPLTHRATEGTWSGMASWLKDRGFSSLTQRSLYDDLKRSSGGSKTGKMSVTVDASEGDMRYDYVPTNVRTADGLGSAVDADGALSNPFWGRRTYSYTSDNVSSSDVFDDASWLASVKGGYVASEKVYSAFARETYTDVDAADAVAIKRLMFDDTTWDSSADVSDYAVISRVRTMLDTLASYTETPATPKRGESFVSWFLDKAHEGNSAYFATVATLAFRTQGIPARYAEGYRVSASNVSMAAKNGKKMVLGNSDVHAWCEVYLDGLGWTPVEVTPGFYAQSVQADSVINVGEAWSGGSKDDALQTGSVMGDVKDHEEKHAERTMPLYLTVLMVIAALLLVFAFAGVVTVIQRQVRIRSIRRRFNDDDQSVCIPVLYRYLTAVMGASGLDFDPTRPLDHLEGFTSVFKGIDVLEYRRIIELHQAYAFGNRRMKPNELRAVRRLTVRMHEALPEPATLRARFKRYAIDLL